MDKFINYFFTLLFISSLLSSCAQEETAENYDKAELRIDASVEGSTTRAVKNTFVVGDELGIYTTYGSLELPYFGVPTNAKSVYNGTIWVSDPVYLTGRLASIFAYSPYTASAGDGKAIPIESTSQTDYLYGTGDRQVNSENASVNIEMKHALAKVVFKIRKQDYAQNATLTGITITGTASYPVYTQGTFNCQTGEITTSGGNGTISLTCTDLLQNDFKELHELLVFPLSGITTKTGDIVVSFSIQTDINTENYKIEIPAPTLWERGNSYVYPLTLNGYGLHLNSTDISITPWDNTLSGSGSTM